MNQLKSLYIVLNFQFKLLPKVEHIFISPKSKEFIELLLKYLQFYEKCPRLQWELMMFIIEGDKANLFVNLCADRLSFLL